MSRRFTILLVATLALLLAAPAMGYSEGPPWERNDRIIPEEGCSCHGAGESPSSEVTVSISGVPRAYTAGESYDMIISLSHNSNSNGGFMIWDYGTGILTPGEGSQVVADSPGALSQSTPGNDWTITWVAPDSDQGDVHISMVGNAVDGDEMFSDGDAWNILTFTINSPGTATIDEDPSLRTISIGDYDSLFGQKSAEQIEAERQAELADDYFTNGNLYFYTTLSILIIAAVIQGEFYERRFTGGPQHLDMSLAIPQGIIRGVMTLSMLILLGWAVDSHLPWGYSLVIGMCTLWGIFGVYRTVVEARAPKQAKDIV